MKKHAQYDDLMTGAGDSDYEKYLNTRALLACQTALSELCNRDELQFQIVHQIEELLMKLAAYTLYEIDACMKKRETLQVLMLFKRVTLCQSNMLHTLDLLATMSPKEYQEIRKKLGRGSGKDSPGFKVISQLFGMLWKTYETAYLKEQSLTLVDIYDKQFHYHDAYMVAEALLDFEVLFQRFLAQHMQTVNRSIGSQARSLNGRDIKRLEARMTMQFFPELWKVRSDMTDRWGQAYGYVRDPIK